MRTGGDFCLWKLSRGLDGTFLSASNTLLKIFACSSFAEVQAVNLSNDVFRYPETFTKLLADSREQPVVHNAETEWRRRDSGFASVRLHLRCISNSRLPDGIEGIVEDVTEVRALERQLLQAQKFETIGQLAGSIAHDFNNVLGAVLGWAEIGYEQSRAHPQIAGYFAPNREQADRAVSLTRELLTFARRQPLQPRPVQLNQIIETLMSFLDKVIGKRHRNQGSGRQFAPRQGGTCANGTSVDEHLSERAKRHAGWGSAEN